MLLKPRSLPELVAEGRVQHVHSLGSHRIPLPPMPIAATFLERWDVAQTAGSVTWRADSYMAVSPAMFELPDVTVHSSAGLIQVDDSILAETLPHTLPARHGYEPHGDSVLLKPRSSRQLRGVHTSVLAGGTGNYFHALIHGTFRLAMIPDRYMDRPGGLLCTAGAVGQRGVRDLLRLPAHLVEEAVADSDALHIQTLMLPLSIHGVAELHPCILALYDRISGHVPEHGEFPRRIYIDRRRTQRRRLVNEDGVIAGLASLGFVAVEPEMLSIADQVRLFRGAEAIVAPHGAGLTNLGFCRPECVVLELHMDAYVYWAFRHLAALRGLRYDCVLGAALNHPSQTGPSIHHASWQVSAPHVAAAIAHMLKA